MALDTRFTGGNAPMYQTPAPAAPTPQASPFAAAPSAYGQNFQDPNAMVQSSLESMLNPNNPLISRARQSGARMAQQRGGINSSIAAGAAEGAALDVAGDLSQQALAIQAQREQVQAEDWMSGQNFNRSMQGQLALMPLTNSFEMLNNIQQYALEDPELYTPEVTSGYSNFFQKNMNNIMSNYFKNYNIGSV
jgi:hypothetical protein